MSKKRKRETFASFQAVGQHLQMQAPPSAPKGTSRTKLDRKRVMTLVGLLVALALGIGVVATLHFTGPAKIVTTR